MSLIPNLLKMSALRKVSRVPQVRLCLSQYSLRTISTSKKKDDTTTAAVEPGTVQADDIHAQPKKKRFFYDYGFYGINEKEEKQRMHSLFFLYITVGFVLAGFYIMYRPQMNFNDWALREAYIELRRREQLGLPPIDANYYDPSTIQLPSDEELGDTEIIV